MYNGVYTAEQYAYFYDTLTKWLRLKLEGGSLGRNLKSKGVYLAAVYGANDFGQMVCRDLADEIEIRAYIDKKAGKMGDAVVGIPLIGIDRIMELPDNCYILVTPEYYFREILEDLMTLGVKEERILSLAMAVL